MSQHERVAKEIVKGKLEYRNDARYFAALSGSEIAEILRREYEPERQMLHDFHATDATIAIQEREEIRQQRDALLVKLAKMRNALGCYADPLFYNEDGVPCVMIGLDIDDPYEPDCGEIARKALKEIGDEPGSETTTLKKQ